MNEVRILCFYLEPRLILQPGLLLVDVHQSLNCPPFVPLFHHQHHLSLGSFFSVSSFLLYLSHIINCQEAWRNVPSSSVSFSSWSSPSPPDWWSRSSSSRGARSQQTGGEREPSGVAGKSEERFTKFASCPPPSILYLPHADQWGLFARPVLMNIMIDVDAGELPASAHVGPRD